jgi:RNA recognition motif. (a.k.a. RRM, RBD, or RNP domain)
VAPGAGASWHGSRSTPQASRPPRCGRCLVWASAWPTRAWACCALGCCSGWGAAQRWQREQDDTTTQAGVIYAYLCGTSALVDHGGSVGRLFASYGLVDSTQIAPAGMGSGARVGFVEMPDTTEARAAIAGLQGHDPTHEDIRVFLGRLKTALTARDLALCGVTTDGSALYPAPLREGFGQVRHQICTFHIMAEIGKAVSLNLSQFVEDQNGQ